MCGLHFNCSKPGLIDFGLKEHTHEEADTQIPLHVLDIVKRSSTIKVDVWSPDSLILLMDLVALQNSDFML